MFEKPPLGTPNDENSISPQLLDDTKWDQWQIIKDQDWLGDNCQVPTFKKKKVSEAIF